MSVRDDLRQAVHRMFRHPAQNLLAVVTLAVGLAMSAVLFTIAREVVFKPFPFLHQERVLSIWANDLPRSMPHLELTYFQFQQISRRARSFDDVALMSAANFNLIANTPEPHQVATNVVSRTFFRLLGVHSAHGRLFSDADHRPNAPGVAILSDRFWHSLFGGDPSIVGRAIDVEGQKTVVVGILPPDVDYPRGADLLIPLEPTVSGEDAEHSTVYAGIGRLRPGVSAASVATELKTIAESLQTVRPLYEGVSISAIPIVDDILGSTRPAMTVLFAMALLVLVIATLNVSSIFVAQVVTRQRELAIRAALGAGRPRLIRTLLFEALVVSIVAATVGAVLAWVALRAFLTIAPAAMPRVGDVAISGETYAFLAIASVVVALVSGLIASLRIDGGRGDLREGTNRGGSAVASRRLLSTLAAVEIGVALTLLAGAALMIRSFEQVAAIDPGFRRDSVLTAQVQLPSSTYNDRAKGRLFFKQLLEKLRGAPGIEVAGAVLVRPLELEVGWDYPFTLEGQSVSEQEHNPLANLVSCSPGYFEAIGTPLLRGRGFNEDDRENAEPVIVVSRSFARRFWNTDDVIGKRVKGGRPQGKGRWRTIVGVVADVRFRGLTTEKVDVYEPYMQSPWTPQFIVARTSVAPRAAEATIRRAVQSIDRGVPVAGVRTADDLVDQKLAQPRTNAWVVGSFAAVALFLSIVGVYAVLSYAVRSRTMEMGIRMALGAGARSVLGLVLREAALLSLAGAAGGVAGALAISHVVGGFLYGIEGTTGPVVAVSTATLVAAAVLGALVPAWRASRVDPAIALRAE